MLLLPVKKRDKQESGIRSQEARQARKNEQIDRDRSTQRYVETNRIKTTIFIKCNQFYKLCIIIFHKRLKHIFTNSFSEDMNNVD